jgi:hypothetical protein
MAFRFRCAISRRMASSPIGLPFSMISSVIGRPTTITSMSISCARACRANGAARTGNARWRRLTEERASGAKSVFHFDVQGSVAKSTHAGIPWLRFIRRRLGDRVHFWPFDGWDIPGGRSAVAEVYPSLWRLLWERRPHGRSARCLLHRRLARARRSWRHPRRPAEAGPFAGRARGSAGRGLDIGRAGLGPCGRAA